MGSLCIAIFFVCGISIDPERQARKKQKNNLISQITTLVALVFFSCPREVDVGSPVTHVGCCGNVTTWPSLY